MKLPSKVIKYYDLCLKTIFDKERVLKPLFKYPGGKGSEYKYLRKLFPEFDTYVEPFLGGGAVYWATEADNWIINDYSQELISIYRYTQEQDELFLNYLEDIGRVWKNKENYINDIMELLLESAEPRVGLLTELSHILLDLTNALPKHYQWLEYYLRDSLIRKRKSLAKIAQKEEIKNWEENSLSILGAGIYTYLRTLYNQTTFEQHPQLKTVLYLFIREYAYSSMFRYNADGMFNVPFGGNSYAKKDFLQRFNQITDDETVNKLRNTTILQGDFSDAFIDQEGAFMFLDPPYDSEFSTYNLHVFDAQEQIRLRDELLQVNQTKWLMVVKSTDFIEELYEHDGWYKFRFDKSYSVNFKNRNEQDVKHLVITNYQLEDI